MICAVVSGMSSAARHGAVYSIEGGTAPGTGAHGTPPVPAGKTPALVKETAPLFQLSVAISSSSVTLY